MKLNTYAIGDLIKIKTTKGKTAIGRIVDMTDNYIELVNKKYNKYKTYLLVEIEEIELYKVIK